MSQKAPGRHYRKGLTAREIYKMFPDKDAAEKWFESIVWQDGRFCPHCGSLDTIERKSRKPMPYRCRENKCRKYFNVRTGTPMAHSNIKLEDWAVAVYMQASSLKGVSSMKLHRELGIGQKAAWFLGHRIREAYEDQCEFGDAEVDEAYFGGLEKNKHEWKKLHAGTGGVGKTALVGVKDRKSGNVHVEVVSSVNRETLHGIVQERTKEGATIYTDEASAYKGMPRKHKMVRHSVGEYVKGEAHTNGVESFWATLKRAHMGTFHKLSPKHLQRYANEFAGRNNVRDLDTIDQMQHTVAQMMGKRLTYKNLKAPNGLSSHAREINKAA